MRYPKREVQAMFVRFIKAFCSNPEQRSDYYLDYASCYGGYVIEKYTTQDGVSMPFGLARKSAKEMYLSLAFACDVLNEMDRTQFQWKPIADEGQV